MKVVIVNLHQKSNINKDFLVLSEEITLNRLTGRTSTFWGYLERYPYSQLTIM